MSFVWTKTSLRSTFCIVQQLVSTLVSKTHSNKTSLTSRSKIVLSYKVVMTADPGPILFNLHPHSLLNLQLRFLNSTKRNHTKRHAKIQYGRFLLDTTKETNVAHALYGSKCTGIQCPVFERRVNERTRLWVLQVLSSLTFRCLFSWTRRRMYQNPAILFNYWTLFFNFAVDFNSF